MLAVFFAVLLIYIVLAQFRSRGHRWILGGLIMVDVSAAFVMTDLNSDYLVTIWSVTFATGLLISAWAAWRREACARYVCGGFAITGGLFALDPYGFTFGHFFPVLLPVLATLVLAMALQLRDEQQVARENRLAATRLEIELLKKSLQPHFLMNTLTALAQAIEENPAIATKLIDDLAAVLRSMGRFAEQKLVTLADELDLCRAHLRVMSVRTERRWGLETVDVDKAALVPPALFLTLIENGFAHQQPETGTGVFALRAASTDERVKYTFFSPGRVQRDASRPPSGTGLRYVKARLEECCTGGWTFKQQEVEGGWETIIDVRHPQGTGAVT